MKVKVLRGYGKSSPETILRTRSWFSNWCALRESDQIFRADPLTDALRTASLGPESRRQNLSCSFAIFFESPGNVRLGGASPVNEQAVLQLDRISRFEFAGIEMGPGNTKETVVAENPTVVGVSGVRRVLECRYS